MTSYAFRVSEADPVEVDGRVEHWHGIHKDNEQVGYVGVSKDKKDPRVLRVENIETNSNGLGNSGVREVARQLKQYHPETKTIEGKRVSGARGGRGVINAGTPHVSVKIKN